jgi:regulatory protein
MKKVVARKSGRGRMNQPSLIIEDTLTHQQGLLAETAKLPATGGPGARREDEPSASEADTRCLNAAIRFLRSRPRSEYEVRARLRHHKYTQQSIDSVITTLKQKGLIDDTAFARFWIDNRDAFRPRSQRLIKAELRQKGVAVDLIDGIEFASDDEEGAYRSARQKARSLPRTDYHSFQRRLGDYLKRRGYGYGVIMKVVPQVWEEGETVL